MSKPFSPIVSAPVPACPQMSRQDRTGQDRTGEDSRPSTAPLEVGLERAGAIPVSAEPGNLRLRAYLTADPKARERFDRRQAREILADCDSEWRALNEIADDPVHRRVEFERWLRRADG